MFADGKIARDAQARTGIITNVAVPQRPVRKTALGANMVVDGGSLDPSSPHSSGGRSIFATLPKGNQSVPGDATAATVYKLDQEFSKYTLDVFRNKRM